MTKQNAFTNMDMTNMDMPYEKFLKLGAGALTDAELLAIIIRIGTKDTSSVKIGQKVLNLSDNHLGLLGLHHITIADLMTINGIGEVKAVKIKCIAELAKRLSKASAAHSLRIDQPKTVADYYMEELRHVETEHTLLVMLDNKNRIINDSIISKGTVNSSLLSPREIFLMALQNKAVYILLLHNHPSGDPTPSKQDLTITKRIMEASKLIGIPLIDHIIIGDNKYISFREKGIL
ncbi:MAG: DNA repair protein RadC [Lachnospiraceae bacterium]|nr:DNA repair protein RadC [Lachnospiraceae bacterium]